MGEADRYYAALQTGSLTKALELKDVRVINRHFVSLPRQQQRLLQAQFPELLELAEVGGAKGFHQLDVSVFDHWLSADEAIAEMDEVSLASEQANNEKLATFARLLASRNQCYLVKFKGRYHKRPVFKEFLSDEKRNRWLTPLPHDVGDNWRFRLLFPQLQMVYFEGSDFTHHIYLKEKGGQQVIEAAAVDAGLYLLSQVN